MNMYNSMANIIASLLGLGAKRNHFPKSMDYCHIFHSAYQKIMNAMNLIEDVSF
jgi:hypothetical protein